MAFSQTLARKESYVPREWNDDDRVNDYISYHYNDTPPHVPVYTILKEMYDEDKARLYHYDLEEEYAFRYGEALYEEVYENGYYQELYSDYYDIYSVTSGLASDIDVIEDSDVEDYRKDKQDGQDVQEQVLDAAPFGASNANTDMGADEDNNEPYQAKFIYL